MVVDFPERGQMKSVTPFIFLFYYSRIPRETLSPDAFFVLRRHSDKPPDKNR